jgi:hypothetical protein
MPPSLSGGLLCAHAAGATTASVAARMPEMTPLRTRFIEPSPSVHRIACGPRIAVAAIMPEALRSGKPWQNPQYQRFSAKRNARFMRTWRHAFIGDHD